MEQTKLKYYIHWVRKITVGEAADEIGYTRQYISEVANGRVAGKKLAIAISNWSNGYLSAPELMQLPE